MPFFHDMFKAPYTSLQELNLDWLLTKVKNILRFVPDDGYVGQILRRTSSGAEWSDEQGGGGAVSSVNGQTGAVVLTASDVGALPDSYTAPVDSVNGQTGAVVIGKSDVGLGNVDNVQQYSASNPPPYPVTSVNGQTGTAVIGKSDVGLGNVDNVQQYSASNPPPYPVTSVNGQTGDVSIVVPFLPISILNGGTGANSADGARSNLFPFEQLSSTYTSQSYVTETAWNRCFFGVYGDLLWVYFNLQVSTSPGGTAHTIGQITLPDGKQIFNGGYFCCPAQNANTANLLVGLGADGTITIQTSGTSTGFFRTYFTCILIDNP